MKGFLITLYIFITISGISEASENYSRSSISRQPTFLESIIIGISHYFTNRVEKSRKVFDENLENALKELKKRNVKTKWRKSIMEEPRRMSDRRLPYFAESQLDFGPQKFVNKTTFEFDMGFTLWLAKYIYRGNSSDPVNWNLAVKYKKIQDAIADSVPFPCNVKIGRSKEKPTSVDKLRPGDIDLIGVLGDSLCMGVALTGTNAYNSAIINEGMTAITGGAKNWRKFFTVANMLKEFNPNLKGYGRYDTILTISYNPDTYNINILASVVDDFPVMAETIVHKMKKDPKININEDWKLIAVFGGNVDVCHDICFWKNMEDAPAYHYMMMERTFDYLMANSPRTIIYYMLPPNAVRFHSGMKNHAALCKTAMATECPCSVGEIFFGNRQKYIEVTNKIIEAELTLINQKKYHEKADFAIIAEPMMTNASYPRRRTPGGSEIDFRYMAVDCFHFSQRGHASVGYSVWNSLLTPMAEKKNFVDWNTYEKIKCPTEEMPFIATPRNSRPNTDNT